MRKLLVLLILLAVIGIAGDRLAAGLAADEAERRLVKEGFTAPSVTMHGFPFLTQLVSRTFDRVSVKADALDAGDGEARAISGELTDVRTPQSGPVQVGALTATGTVPYAVVSRAVGSAELQLAPAPDGEVEVTRTVDVAGQSFDVVARARVQARGARLRIVPTDLQVEGLPRLDDRLSALISERVALVYDIPDLPSGVQVESVTATEAGFAVRVGGRDLSVSVSADGIRTPG